MSKSKTFGALKPLFVTEVYQADFSTEARFADFIEELDDTCRAIADEDEAGWNWSQEKGYIGYTSYASLNDLPQRAPVFANLKARLDQQVAHYAKLIELDLPKPLSLNALWINILEPLGGHSNHIHPHSVVSGTFYVSIPDGTSGLMFEDPRLDRFMAAPTRTNGCDDTRKTFVRMTPKAGTLLLWESWLRHEVPINRAEDVRISVSFNYA